MNAAASEEENNAERGTGAPAPALVLVRTRAEPCAAGSPSRAGNASRHDEVLEDRLTGRPSPAGPIGQAMTAMDVRAALAQLRPGHRQVIVEMFYLGRSVTEIAQLLSIPEGTVTSRGYDGLRQLRRLLPAASGEPPRRRWRLSEAQALRPDSGDGWGLAAAPARR